MQSIETKSSRPRPKSFETETPKTGLETRLETEAMSRDSITGVFSRLTRNHCCGKSGSL